MTDTTTTANSQKQLPPDTEGNHNCLKGIKCPQCGNEDRFFIIGGAQFEVTDDGSETIGDHEWDDESLTRCPDCGRDGPLAEFRI